MSARTPGAAAGTESWVRSWVRLRFSLEVSRSASFVLSDEAAAARFPGELPDQRRVGGAEGEVFTIGGLTAGAGGVTFASLLAAINFSRLSQTEHPQSMQLLWLDGQTGSSRHFSVTEAGDAGLAFAVGAWGGGSLVGETSGRGGTPGAFAAG